MPPCCGAELERSESKSHMRRAERWAGVKNIKWCVSRAEQVVAWVGNFAAPLYTCSESMDFKRLVNFSELAQPHSVACLFGMKYLCKYRCCFSPSFGTERYWRFRRSFSISVSVLVHSGSGQIVRCTVLNVWWKFGADTATQREVIRGGTLKRTFTKNVDRGT